MIRITRKRKNPEPAEFKRFSEGWHVTKPANLEMILQSGYLKPNSNKNLALSWEADYYSYFESGFTPLFFAQSLEILEKNFYIQKTSKILKVNIENYSQYPDLPMLANYAKTTKDGLYFDYQVPTKLQGRMKLKEIIPFSEFFTNKRLGAAVINYTRSVTIMENIPISSIIDVQEGSSFY
jgi:hypothetical protein